MHFRLFGAAFLNSQERDAGDFNVRDIFERLSEIVDFINKSDRIELSSFLRFLNGSQGCLRSTDVKMSLLFSLLIILKTK